MHLHKPVPVDGKKNTMLQHGYYCYLLTFVNNWSNNLMTRDVSELPLRLARSSVVCQCQLPFKKKQENTHHHHHHHHHHVPEGLGVFPVPSSARWSWSLHLFLGRPMFLRPCGLHCSACFGSLFVSILCTCCSNFSWYCFIPFTMFLLQFFA